ncbi:MAG: rRNA adenine dimethyltransferase family protein [Candidatus Peregrinibacteria bacterium]
MAKAQPQERVGATIPPSPVPARSIPKEQVEADSFWVQFRYNTPVMQIDRKTCQAELEKYGLIPKKYHGQVFTVDGELIDQFIDTVKSLYRPGTKIVEIGAGLGYISQKLAENFDDIDCLEIDENMISILNKKFERFKNTKIIQEDILNYNTSSQEYLLVGNIPFHISGRLYRRFMSEEKHKPYGMVFITDKQYANTLMGQPPRCYRVSLQAQAYGDIKIVADVPPSACYPEPKVMSCIMKITRNSTPLPKNFWKVVNYHFENFPTKEIKSPKTMNLQGWIKLAASEPGF